MVVLSGSSVNLTPVATSSAFFDFAGHGFAAKTGWITPNEGFLILDKGTSTITPDELFGVASGNGFDDLAKLDLNGDGVINASDAQFANLKIWRDLNSNGQLDPGELACR